MLIVLHGLIGYMELGVDSWQTRLMENLVENSVIVLIYTSLLMFVLRFCAGPIVHKLNPIGLLLLSSVIAVAGLFWLSIPTDTVFVLFAAATLYSLGKAFLWPTMLAVAGERYPQSGAVAMSALGAAGMIAVGFVGGKMIGAQQSNETGKALANTQEVHARYSIDNDSFLGFHFQQQDSAILQAAMNHFKLTSSEEADKKAVALEALNFVKDNIKAEDSKALGVLLSKDNKSDDYTNELILALQEDDSQNKEEETDLLPEIVNIASIDEAINAQIIAKIRKDKDIASDIKAADIQWDAEHHAKAFELKMGLLENLVVDSKEVVDAYNTGGRQALWLTALIPTLMSVGFFGLFLYYRSQGGYKVITLDGGDEDSDDYPVEQAAAETPVEDETPADEAVPVGDESATEDPPAEEASNEEETADEADSDEETAAEEEASTEEAGDDDGEE